MNNDDKQVIQYQLDEEKAILNDLKRQYKRALRDINDRIKILQAEDSPSRAYQADYQKTLKAQVEAILEKLHADEYDSIHKYLSNSYTTGYVGAMFNMGRQSGVHVITPIDRNAAHKAIVTDSELSTELYGALGYDMDKLKKHIREEITRGIATSLPYDQIARNISNYTTLPLSNAKRIVRTEGHRIQQASANDARNAAKEKGADVVKQWDASLDGATRKVHRELDGQIRETNEPFTDSSGKWKAMYPGKFGKPEQDCNCRCVALTRARWALDEKELETLKERAAYFKIDKEKDFKEYTRKYLYGSISLENIEESGIIDTDELTPCLKRLSDGKYIDTEVLEIHPTRKAFKDWEFDWTKPERDGYMVRAIKVTGDDRIQGMVALKADPKNYAVVVDIVESAPFNNPHNKLFKEKEYSGVGGHLFAEAVRESYKLGYDGFVFFKAKTNLIDYYEKEFKAQLINPRERIMMIDEKAAKDLYEKYYKE